MGVTPKPIRLKCLRNTFIIDLQQSAVDVKTNLVVMSFARHGRSQVQSFPRKRESTPQAIGDAPPTDWIPAPRLRGDKLRGND